MKLNITSRSEIPNYLNALDYKGVGVEVGVLRGDFSRILLQNWNGTKLYMVDTWAHNSNNIDLNNGDHLTQLDNFAATFRNIYEYGSKSCILRDSSSEASKLFKDNSLDFVYLDAGHDYKSVTEDLDNWWSKIRQGGMLLGDDYIDGMLLYNGLTLFEVRRAVEDFAAKLNKEVWFSHPKEGEPSNPQFYIKK